MTLPAHISEAIGLLEELRDHKPTVFSGRAHDPQDDVDDMMPLAEFEAFQEDAARILSAARGIVASFHAEGATP